MKNEIMNKMIVLALFVFYMYHYLESFYLSSAGWI